MAAEILRMVAASGLLLAAVALAASPDIASAATTGRKSHPQATGDDQAIFRRLVEATRESAGSRPGKLVAAAGLALRGTPYAAGTLEIPGPERLVCNLRGLDCVTFVETCLAVARSARRHDTDFRAFLAELAAMRYRDGRPEGYASRLHYFSEWIRRNAARHVIADITRDLGGVAQARPIRYMSGNRKLYPRLAHQPTYDAVRRIEQELSVAPLVAIPRSDIAAIVDRLEDGDILAFVPATEGLDVSHTGLAYRDEANVAHLLHAPDVGEAVRIDPEALGAYVARHRKIQGLIVARPL